MNQDQIDPAANEDTPEEALDFNTTPWHFLMGIRTPEGLLGAATLDIKFVGTPLACIPDGKGNDVFDKTIPAVHFATWLERQKAHLVALWEVEYAQYMNLRRLTAPAPAPGVALVDTTGQRLSTDIVQ